MPKSRKKINFPHHRFIETSRRYAVICAGRTGSAIISSNGNSGRQLNFYPPVHIIIANKSQIVDYLEDGLKAIQEKYGKQTLPSLISFISGPSRTADIEKTLVLGAHGPKTLHVFIYE